MTRHDRNKPLYMISVAAELAGVHPQTLRIYESKGIITPSRSAGNTRLYSEADVDQLKLVQRLTTEGINLAGVVRILDLELRIDEAEMQAEELRAQVRLVERQLHEMKMREAISSMTRAGTVLALGTGEDADEPADTDFTDE